MHGKIAVVTALMLTAGLIFLGGCGPDALVQNGSSDDVVRVEGYFEKADSLVDYDVHFDMVNADDPQQLVLPVEETLLPMEETGTAIVKIDPPKEDAQQPKLTISTKWIEFPARARDAGKYIVITVDENDHHGTFWWNGVFSLEAYSNKTGKWYPLKNEYTEKAIIEPGGRVFGCTVHFTGDLSAFFALFGIEEYTVSYRKLDEFPATEKIDETESRLFKTDKYRLRVFPIWNWLDWEQGPHGYTLNFQVVDWAKSWRIRNQWMKEIPHPS